MSPFEEQLYALLAQASISGQEKNTPPALIPKVEQAFTSQYHDAAGNHFYVRKSKTPGAKLLLLDAHFDEIGLMVKELLPGGFVRVSAVGGVDAKPLPASEVILYGKEEIHGVVASTPPHLQTAGETAKPVAVKDLLIDTGYDLQTLSQILSVGDMVGFLPKVTTLANDCICSKGLDDKICAAIALYAAATARLAHGWDVCVCLAAREEVGSIGAQCAVTALHPDAAIAMDVEFARMPGTPKAETTIRFAGVTVAYSAVTDRALTDVLIRTAQAKKIPYQTVAWPNRTGTDADRIGLGQEGIPCALIGVPIFNMHTPVETASLSDAKAALRLLTEMLEGGMTAWENR